jgi:hypothetical protein
LDCSADVSEILAASITKADLMMYTVRNVGKHYQATRRYNPEGSNFQQVNIFQNFVSRASAARLVTHFEAIVNNQLGSVYLCLANK